MDKATRHTILQSGVNLLSKLESAGFSPVMLALFVLLAVIPLFLGDEYVMRLMVVSLLLGGQAMLFDFTASSIDIINFGFAGFVGLGAYTSGLLAIKLGLSPWIGLPAAAIASGAVGLLTGLLTLRLRGIYAAVMAWFVGLSLMAIASAWIGLTRGTRGINVPFLLDTAAMRPYYYVLLPVVLLIYITLAMINKSKLGLAFRAIGQNVEAAQASGINPTRFKVLNWTTSTAFAGLLGGFYGHFIGILIPSVMATDRTVEVLALSYIGGPGSLWGGILAAFLVTPIFDYLKSLMEFRLIIYAGLLGATIVFYPDGLAGTLRGLLDNVKTKMRS